MPRSAATKQQRPAAPRIALTIAEFCKAAGIGRTLYFQLRKRGLGPREMRFGNRVLISMAAADQWRQQLEENSP